MRLLLFCGIVCVFCTPASLIAQDINGDTIKVYGNSLSILVFPKNSEIDNLKFLTGSADKYSIEVTNGSKLQIRAAEHPETCSLFLSEVRGSHELRKHLFIVTYIPDNPSDPRLLFNDYSSVEKIKARVAYLKKASQAASDAGPEILPERVVLPKEHNAVPERQIVRTKGTDAVKTTPNSAVEEEDTALIVLTEKIKIRKEDFRKKARLQTQNFEQTLQYLGSKSNGPEDCLIAIDNLIKNSFINEEVLVEVSSKKPGVAVQRPKIRAYLKKIMGLRYDHIDLSWTDIMVAPLVEQPDGTFRGFVEFQQRFSGFKGEKMLYTDITRKRMEVVVVVSKSIKHGSEVSSWNVFLSDIGVEHTM